MVINYISKVDKELIQIVPAVKVGDVWETKVKYDAKQLLFHTPRCKIVKDTYTLVVNKKEFKEFLNNLRVCFIDHIFENSKTIFNGKTFSREKIESSLESMYDEDDANFVYLTTECNKNLQCSDPLGELTTYEDLGENIRAVLHVCKIVFNKNVFKIVLKISHLKMLNFKIQHISFENSENDNFFD